jgi:putative transposase
MTSYHRRLPHVYAVGQPIFLTWRLAGSLPPNRVFPSSALTSGQAFAAMDRLLDEARGGPFYLRQAQVADMIVDAILYNATTLEHYVRHAFAVMPNHVHLLVTPSVPLPRLTKSLKGITAKGPMRCWD